ncbi:MAG: type VI secretion system tip protein VgrG [Pseudomonadota bacterium]|nr:type VI secretion system tip protein VgrG [Pseudomonadota bacterium]
MNAFTQEQRLIALEDSPLGRDELLLAAFSGREEISRLFSYRLELLSPRSDIAAREVVGRRVAVSVRYSDRRVRHFNGFVSRFAASGLGLHGLRSYRAEMVPWLWFLTRTSDCRIFQNQSVPQIVETVFTDLGFNDYDIAQIKGAHGKWDYCVQYRESAFNFVSRLLEQEGIFYWFRHARDRHTLLLADHKGAYAELPESQVDYTGGGAGALAQDHITHWEHEYAFRSGRWTQTDYNFETPGTSLKTSTPTLVDLAEVKKYEVYDYPGEYQQRGDGETLTHIRMEEEEAAHDTVSAAGNCRSFTPGGTFTLRRHECPAEKKTYLITAITHHASEPGYAAAAAGGAEYANAFTCIPADVTFRPPRLTAKPSIQGPQTAVVVGPAGEEIYPDQYGRVKVQFHWDRRGGNNEHSSCWVRVSQPWAGQGWGAVAIPRIGQEVIVEFLEGDPDRPIITGRVYNAGQMPPYALPANKTQTGIKSRSSKGGGAANGNELRFEDKKGAEQLLIHAEKNQDLEVENDETHWVGHDRAKTIDHDETSHIRHDRTETVDHNETITIGNDRTETVIANETLTVNQNRTRTVSQNETVTVVLTRTHSVGVNEMINVGAAQEITIGGLQALTVGLTRAVTVGRSQDVSIGKTLTIDAGEQIVIRTGKASITLKKDGTISIQGKDITIKGSGGINVKADKNVVIKGKKILEN